jgi:hypothetical protein
MLMSIRFFKSIPEFPYVDFTSILLKFRIIDIHDLKNELQILISLNVKTLRWNKPRYIFYDEKLSEQVKFKFIRLFLQSS